MKKKQNPFVYYLCLFAYMLLMLLLRVVMLAPISCLFFFGETTALCFLSLLTPAIFLLVVLPLRFSFADAIVRENPQDRYFSFGKALSFSRYGAKLGQSILHGVKILLWGLPFYLIVGYSYYVFSSGKNLAFLQIYLPNLGKVGLTVLYSVANFFLRIAKKDLLVVPKQTLAEGIVFLFVLLAVSVLIWLIGAVLCSGRRYLWALSEHNDTTVNTEFRHHLMGRRWAQLGNGLVNFLLVVPFLIVTFLLIKSLFTNAYNIIILAMMGVNPNFDTSILTQNAVKLVVAFLGLYMTVLPIRRYRTAAFITHRSRKSKD